MHMRRAFIWLVGVWIFSLATIVYGGAGEPVELITPEESALPEADPSTWHIEAGLTGREGPAIEVVSPKLDKACRSPLPLKIRFVPRENREVDLSTLRVEYLKFFTIDITSRVRPYATKEGIEVPEAKLPSGTHTIRVHIGDVSGAITERIFTVRVL